MCQGRLTKADQPTPHEPRSVPSGVPGPARPFGFPPHALLVLAGCSNEVAPALTDAPPLELAADLRMDAEVENFSTVNRVVAGPDGQVAIPLSQDFQIRIYDSLGRVTATSGRRGSGPGEFLGFGGMNWLGDTIFAADHHQGRRVHFFGPGGHHLRSSLLPQAFPPPSAGGDRARPVGLFFFTAQMAAASNRLIGQAIRYDPGGRSDGPRSVPVVGALDADGSLIELATIATVAQQDSQFVWSSGFGRAIPFAANPQVAFASDGSRFAILRVDQSSSEAGILVTMIRAGGDTIFARRYPVRGTPISSAEADSAVAAMASQGGPASLAEGPPIAPFQRAASGRIPAVHPPAESMVVGSDGSAWITLRTERTGQEALLVDSLGQAVGTARLPPRSRVRSATARHLWVIEMAEDGLASVVRYRIMRRD